MFRYLKKIFLNVLNSYGSISCKRNSLLVGALSEHLNCLGFAVLIILLGDPPKSGRRRA